MSKNPVSPPPIPTGSPPATSSGVRRVHTISASSRPARASARLLPEEAQQQQTWNDDEVVDQDWVGGVGAVGENAGLHRQTSLPTRYNKAFGRISQNRQGGTLTPRTINSLTAIAAEHGHEGEEEEWENEMRGWNGDERLDGHDMPSQQQQYAHVVDSQSGSSHGHSPLSPSFPPQTSSPPPAEVNVRRNQSLTYGAAGGNVRRTAVNLRRSGTLQAQMERPHASSNTSPPSPVDNEEDFNDEERFNNEEYQYALLQQQQQQQKLLKQQQTTGQYNPGNDVGRSSPWSLAHDAGNSNWGYGAGISAGSTNTNDSIDDVQRALASLDMSNSGILQNQPFNGNNGGQGMLPPRLNQQGLPIGQTGSIRAANGLNDTASINLGLGGQRAGGKLQLNTDIDVNLKSGPSSASTNVPTIGHGLGQRRGSNASAWSESRERTLGSRSSNPNLQYSARNYDATGLPPNPPIPSQYLNQQGAQTQAAQSGATSPFLQNQQASLAVGLQQQNFISPIDVPSLITAKGYNPSTFDCRPAFARYFVIKSYTEDDVHKSLKYEIWSSTDPGNKRLDKAFKDTASRGPIYLFFSVNASGHFCGMAEMMTAVDYTRSSTVWASDKWKGVFKVRWIFVRDIPNANLRHIKLNNTQERKPVTNSRDTQELLPDAGQEMLRIFFTHPARTSLLQDFAFYELQAMQKIQQQTTSPGSPPLHPTSPQPQQHPFAMPNPYSQNIGGLPNQMLTGQVNSQFAVQSNIMRNPSPVPVNAGNHGYAGNF